LYSFANNKAGGYDRILHEYIKSTIDQCMHIYVKFLNLVFDSGCLPECWTAFLKSIKQQQNVFPPQGLMKLNYAV
jgi:hypothetical protein